MSIITTSSAKFVCGSRLQFKMRTLLMVLSALLFVMQFPLVSGAWIDEDTPEDKYKTTSMIDHTEYELVMSDEFNTPGRTFADGDDPTWTALDKTDDDMSAGGTGSLHFYNSSMVRTTKDGKLEILTNLDKTKWITYDQVQKKNIEVVKNFKSGMVQSWNKFCFTGGILEVDMKLPGEALIGGLWPAVWMLGNLGRATYEASTNGLWPWSYNKCDRKLQKAQKISACNVYNHYGLNPKQGRGATEIDLLEAMPGYAPYGNFPLPQTYPGIAYPFADMTLQIAPGVPNNRPVPGYQPLRQNLISGHTEYLSQTWYEGLEVSGQCSLNPFFYGTYLGPTKPDEPVQRSPDQAYQADAIGSMYQLNQEHFRKFNKFRIEWQPGKNGRIDWFARNINGAWEHSFSIKDKSLSDMTGAQIPNEPSYLILNTAVSSTWSFPHDSPSWCPKCYDCSNSTCSCAFYPGFCNMLKNTKTAFYIDSVRLYQSTNHDAHVGSPHTIGCDPVEYPTRTFIKAHESLYMRSPPFDEGDTGSLKEIKNGGGKCQQDSDCGGFETATNQTEPKKLIKRSKGKCVPLDKRTNVVPGRKDSEEIKICKCNEGYTGPFCLAQSHRDPYPGAREIELNKSIFSFMKFPVLPLTLIVTLFTMVVTILVGIVVNVRRQRLEIMEVLRGNMTTGSKRNHGYTVDQTITGRSY